MRRKGQQTRRACDHARLLFDLDGIEIVLRARHAPTAPLGRSGHDNRIASRKRMSCAVFGRLPFVALTDDAPVIAILGDVLELRLFGLQFVGSEFASESDV